MTEKAPPGQEPATLEDMLGLGKGFKVGEHRYEVLPLKLREVKAYTNDLLWLQTPAYLMENPEGSKKTNGWLEGHLRTMQGEPVTLDMATADDWDVEDLKRCLRTLAGISG